MKKFAKDFFSYGGYGWAGNEPAILHRRMKNAVPVFERLRYHLNFDAVAFSGSSGCCIAFVLAYETNIPLLYVRKPRERSHGSLLECNVKNTPIKKYLIVDDFIDTGDTVRDMVNRINRQCSKKKMNPPEPVGVFLFETTAFAPPRIRINEDDFLDCWTPNSSNLP